MQAIRLGQLELLMFLFVGLTLLIVVGLVVYIATARRRKQRAVLRPRSQPVLGPAAQPEPAAPNPYTAVRSALSLLRDPDGGPIRVEIDGVVYSTMADIANPELKRKIIGLAMELIQFVGVLKAQQPPVATMDRTKTWREDLRANSQAASAQAQSAHPVESRSIPEAPMVPDVEDRFLHLLTEMGLGQPTVQKPSLVRSIQHTLQPKPAPTDGPRSFVDHIEELVQRRVQSIPDLAGRGLHVQPGLGAQVVFVYDGHGYASLDEIPDQVAQELIRDAIREWDELT